MGYRGYIFSASLAIVMIPTCVHFRNTRIKSMFVQLWSEEAAKSKRFLDSKPTQVSRDSNISSTRSCSELVLLPKSWKMRPSARSFSKFVTRFCTEFLTKFFARLSTRTFAKPSTGPLVEFIIVSFFKPLPTCSRNFPLYPFLDLTISSRLRPNPELNLWLYHSSKYLSV